MMGPSAKEWEEFDWGTLLDKMGTENVELNREIMRNFEGS